MDPITGCNCITDEEYLTYFPTWATQKDIDISYKLSYQQQKYDKEDKDTYDGGDKNRDRNDSSSFMDKFNNIFGGGQDGSYSLVASGVVGSSLLSLFIIHF